MPTAEDQLRANVIRYYALTLCPTSKRGFVHVTSETLAWLVQLQPGQELDPDVLSLVDDDRVEAKLDGDGRSFNSIKEERHGAK